jgi:ribokinase
MAARLTVVGSLNMDLVIRAPRIPQPGETIIGGAFHTVPGGKGANQAVAAARLGAHVAMVGRVGNDPYGEVLLQSLSEAGVDGNCVTQDNEASTGVALIVVDDNGQNSIVVASGANMRLAPSDVERAEASIAASDALVLQLECPLQTVMRAAEIAHRHGVIVVLNPAPARSLPAELLAHLDVLIPNESEAMLLTNTPLTERFEAKSVAGLLLNQGVGAVVITLGARGALVAREEGTELIPAFPVEPVDTTAAGDAFVAGFAVAMANGKSLPEAVRWGNGAGALAATRLGAQSSLPQLVELERFLDGYR